MEQVYNGFESLLARKEIRFLLIVFLLLLLNQELKDDPEYLFSRIGLPTPPNEILLNDPASALEEIAQQLGLPSETSLSLQLDYLDRAVFLCNPSAFHPQVCQQPSDVPNERRPSKILATTGVTLPVQISAQRVLQIISSLDGRYISENGSPIAEILSGITPARNSIGTVEIRREVVYKHGDGRYRLSNDGGVTIYLREEGKGLVVVTITYKGEVGIELSNNNELHLIITPPNISDTLSWLGSIIGARNQVAANVRYPALLLDNLLNRADLIAAYYLLGVDPYYLQQLIGQEAGHQLIADVLPQLIAGSES